MRQLQFIPTLITAIVTVIIINHSSFTLTPVDFRNTDYLLALFLPFGVYQFVRLVMRCFDWYNGRN